MHRTILSIATAAACLAGVPLGAQEKVAVPSESAELTRLVQLVADTQIFFPKSSAYLRTAEKKKLDLLAKALGNAPGETLIVTGMTDHRGAQEFNSWLREERSAAVVDKLTSLGIEKTRLLIDEQVEIEEAKTDPSGSAADMRRVDFSLKGHEEAIANYLAAPPAESEVAHLPTAADVPQEDSKNFRELRKSDAGLNTLKRAAASTLVYFEYTSNSVRSEYWRDLKQLAKVVLATPNGAIAIRGFASPRFAEAERKRLGNRRSVGAAAKLNALGVGWDRILILPATGESTFPAPHWRNHRVELFPRVMLHEPKTTLAETRTSEDEIPRALPSPSDPLSVLAKQAVIYFSTGSESLKEVDRRALKEIARMLSSDNETRSLIIQTFIDTDATGAETLEVCELRQNAVLDFLMENDAPSRKLLVRTQPMTAKDIDGPSWRQRRVELVVREGNP